MEYLKDPLVAFLLIGAAIFGVDAWRSSGPDVVRVGPLDIERLQDHWQMQMGRPPTQTELDGLIDAHVREEIFVREARKIGLDDDGGGIGHRIGNQVAKAASPSAVADWEKGGGAGLVRAWLWLGSSVVGAL
ncbi:MAG: hypothetical protein OXH52_18500 [Gammaproteobacteria bacterium]|nr:hypothetical protein [Gammaproteobacteria bacterium]